MTLSDTHRGHHSDSLIPALASLYGWEPFFWATDRNGQLLPLLAAPIRHPLANLLVQFGLSVFAGVAALGLVARYAAPAAWPAAAAAAWAVVLFAGTEYTRFNMLNPCQPYAVSLALAAAGLLLAERGGRWRWAAAVALAAAAGWVNFGLGLNVGPWLVGRWLWAGASAATTARGLGLVAGGTAAGLAMQARSAYHDVRLTFRPAAEWPAAWERLAADLGEHAGGLLLAAAALAAVGAARRAAVGNTAAAAAALAVVFLFLGTTQWAAQNGYSSRYLFPSVVLLTVAAAAAAADRLARPGAAAALLPLLTLAVYGWPSVAAARAAIDDATGAATADVRALRCTHLSGEYWAVWPAVFHANLDRADRGEPGVVWGVTFRSIATHGRWGAVPPADVRVGWLVPAGAAEPAAASEGWWRAHYPGHREAGRAPRVWAYAAP